MDIHICAGFEFHDDFLIVDRDFLNQPANQLLIVFSDVLQRNVEAVLTGTDGISLDEIDARLEELQKELLNVANAKGNYDSIVDEIYMLREAKQNAQVEGAEREGMKQRISEMQQFLAEQTQDMLHTFSRSSGMLCSVFAWAKKNGRCPL